MSTEKEIVGEYQRRRERLNEIWNKVSELEAEVAEHDLVCKTLEPMDANRKCFRLIGEVLVERTVGETRPAVVGNKEKLEAAIKNLQETGKNEEKELTEFQVSQTFQLHQTELQTFASAYFAACATSPLCFQRLGSITVYIDLNCAV